jgi:hypothetical protein
MADDDTKEIDTRAAATPGNTRVLGAVGDATAQSLTAIESAKIETIAAIRQVGHEIIAAVRDAAKPFEEMATTLKNASEAIGNAYAKAKELGWRALIGAIMGGSATAGSYWAGLWGG